MNETEEPFWKQESDDGSERIQINEANQHGKNRFTSKTKCNDVLFAVLFIAQFIAVIVLMIVFRSGIKTEIAMQFTSYAIVLINIILIMNVVIAFLFIYFFRKFPKQTIWAGFIFMILLTFAFTVFAFVKLSILMGIISLIGLIIECVFMYLIRKRVAFSAAILKICAKVLKKFPAILLVVLFSLVISFPLVFIYSLTIENAMNKYGRNSGTFILIALGVGFSFYWVFEVISGWVHVVISGVAARWYFLYPGNRVRNPTIASTIRASTYSFGSICFGAAFTALIKTVRMIIQSLLNDQNEFIRCFVMCILNFLTWLVEYFNIYAFTNIAIYGNSYIKSAKETFKLLSERGVDAVVNDSLIDKAIFCCIFASGLLSVLFGYLYTFVFFKSKFEFNNPTAWTVLSLFIGIMIVGIALEAVMSLTIAFFVCYAMDPNALAVTKPKVYKKVTDAWDKAYQ